MMAVARARAVTNIVQRDFGIRQKLLVDSRDGLECLRTARRKWQKVAGLTWRRFAILTSRLGRLLQHHMSIGAAKSERADASQRWTALDRPRTRLRLHSNRELIERYMRI